jgi:lysophospholipase L1-like esterase
MEWKTAWSYLPSNYNTCIGTISDITQRSFFRNNLNGTKIKIKLSNLYSKHPLILDEVVIGKKDRTDTKIEEMQTVTYQGNNRIIIDPGKEFYSDEINLSLCPKEDIVLSIYVKDTTEISSVCSTWSARSWNTMYGLNGNCTRQQEFEAADSSEIYPVLKFDPNKANNIMGITEIKVYTEIDVKTVALFGDSITHMSYYSDALMERLYDIFPGEITIVNRGLGGNRLLRDYSRIPELPGGGTIFGAAGVERFYHDIYSTDQPEFVLVLIGINDFTHPYALKHYEEAVTAEEYQEGITKLIRTAHENGSKVMIGTITPIKYEETDWYATTESLRQSANEWIRSQKLSDGIIDFDLATRKSEDPEYMLENCHLGDGLHPNALGGKKMAEAVPLEWFK